MNPHRKGNAFPQAGVPGDPRLLDQLHRQMVRGPNMQITHTHSGTLISPILPSRRIAGESGPFCRQYLVTGPPRKRFLLGGAVSGGIGNEVVPDIELCEIGSEPVDGTHVYLTVSFTAYVEDDVLLPGGDVTAVSDGSGTTLPDNVLPTADDTAGTLIISLGQWANGVFTSAGCGNIAVTHCLGSLTSARA